ncbi:MAG: hypothetical protein V1911_02760 [Candidatus Micrarchaeota archaeon]
MQDVQTSFRMPGKLESEVEKLVDKGYYKSKTELYISGIRREVTEAKQMSSSVKDVRKIRAEIWEDCFERAKGSRKKAVNLMIEDAEKICDGNPNFWK